MAQALSVSKLAVVERLYVELPNKRQKSSPEFEASPIQLLKPNSITNVSTFYEISTWCFDI